MPLDPGERPFCVVRVFFALVAGRSAGVSRIPEIYITPGREIDCAIGSTDVITIPIITIT